MRNNFTVRQTITKSRKLSSYAWLIYQNCNVLSRRHWSRNGLIL